MWDEIRSINFADNAKLQTFQAKVNKDNFH